jgi:hypothetical protein
MRTPRCSLVNPDCPGARGPFSRVTARPAPTFGKQFLRTGGPESTTRPATASADRCELGPFSWSLAKACPSPCPRLGSSDRSNATCTPSCAANSSSLVPRHLSFTGSGLSFFTSSRRASAILLDRRYKLIFRRWHFAAHDSGNSSVASLSRHFLGARRCGWHEVKRRQVLLARQLDPMAVAART